MAAPLDLTGQVFGQWTVGKRVRSPNMWDRHHTYFVCTCTCGNEGVVRGSALVAGTSTRCVLCGQRIGVREMQRRARLKHASERP